MKNLSAELKVGIFAIVVIMVLSYMTFKVGGLPMVWEKGYRLYAEFNDISGLDEKSRIKVAGVEAGIVEKISLEDGRAKITLLINPDIKVYGNSAVTLRMSGLLGDRYIALSTGTSDQPLLGNGDTISNILPATDIDVLANKLTSAAGHISDLTRSIQDVFGDSERAAIRESIHNLRALTMNLNEISGENRESLRKIIAQLEVFTEALGEKGPGMIDDLSYMARTVGDKGPELVDNLNEAARELRDVIEENRYAFKESVENIRSMSESAGNIARKIEAGEGTIGKLMTDNELYSSINNVAKEAEKASNFAGRLRTYLDFHTEYNTGESEWKGFFELTLRPREDQYYILGIVSDPVGSVDTTVTTIDGVTETKEEVESRIEFTAQYAKKFGDLALRIGIMESTFGFGADYFFDNERGRVKFDMWDLNADEAYSDDAHIRVGIDYRVFKLLFLSAGYDNPLNSERDGVYIGGGIKFEDKDLKYLLGSTPSISLR